MPLLAALARSSLSDGPPVYRLLQRIRQHGEIFLPIGRHDPKGIMTTGGVRDHEAKQFIAEGRRDLLPGSAAWLQRIERCRTTRCRLLFHQQRPIAERCLDGAKSELPGMPAVGCWLPGLAPIGAEQPGIGVALARSSREDWLSAASVNSLEDRRIWLLIRECVYPCPMRASIITAPDRNARLRLGVN